MKDPIRGVFVRGALALGGKPMTRADATKLLKEAALAPQSDERTMLMHQARLVMMGALANEKRGARVRGSPRGKRKDDTAAHKRMQKIAADTGERQPYTLARLAVPDGGESVWRRLVRGWRPT